MKKAQANELNISIDKVYTTDDFDFNLLKTDKFYKEYTVQLGMGAHAYSLTKTTDSKGQSVYYLFNPHNQGLPIKIYDLDTLLTKQNVIQSIIIAKKGE